MAALESELRRQHERVSVTGPAALSADGHTIGATIKDVSLGGVFLFSDAPFSEGAEVEIVLMLPKELGLECNRMVRCHGRVVRVEGAAGQFGIAAQIERIVDLPKGAPGSAE
ncbi:MAG: PilZ domain-containing protein [Acidobacteriia bacterium]|nr:PilZ domain-containing protein [Terriglobia bacterium]